MTKTTDINQTTLLAISCLLKQGKHIDRTSTTVAMMTVFICCVSIFLKISFIEIIGSLSLISLMLWLIQKYYSIRTSIDTDLFSYLAANSQSANERINELDDCFSRLILKKKNNSNWLKRQKGALNLLKKQLVFFIAQVILFFIVLVSLFFNL
ncbi:hypothetical protein RHO14_02535 [Orbus wheelerorum]|uniref:hypothetical protein n=1 Tax=Orbus wheelerorum TaxID=3074111 RepID=UPI00370D6A51